ncbi:hypothetical protein CLU79DRAFT_724609 [Phycomyces nitens]|nr:hypothetical protein CLU79DRAFT_724609 [Phycomyces nitens]
MFGLATVFLSIACHTTTVGISRFLGIQYTVVPWYLCWLVVHVATLENAFLMANAVLSAGCDMQVKEKVCRGIQSVGVPMTATLVAEMLILSIGTAMDHTLIKEFCLFTKIALLVDYVLQFTFFLAMLSIDIRRVELADLGDSQLSKRLRELVHVDPAIEQGPDFCPVQDTPDEHDSKSCAECKDFKTHRAVNALMLCLIILALALFRSKGPNVYSSLSAVSLPSKEVGHLELVSAHFWQVVNPLQETQWLNTKPPYLIVLAKDADQGRSTLANYVSHYEAKTAALQTVHTQRLMRPPPSMFRAWIYSVAETVFLAVIQVNLPSFLLCVVLVAIVMWITPRLRDRWLLPFLETSFVHITLRSLSFVAYMLPWITNFLNQSIIQALDFQSQQRQQQNISNHQGAISSQAQFDKTNRVGNVSVKTLSGQHVADIHRIAVNHQHNTLVSSGQDGRLVLWDTNKADWMARLEPTKKSALNPVYYPSRNRQPASLQTKNPRPSSPVRSVEIDKANKWIATGAEDGVVRIWNALTGQLVHSLSAESLHVETMDNGIRKRHGTSEGRKNDAANSRVVDRVLGIQWVGSTDKNEAQTRIVSIHKSGMLREWDVTLGECVQQISTGHLRDVTVLHCVESAPGYIRPGTTWVFTASKEGMLKCWERDISTDRPWNCVYTIDGHHGQVITCIAIEFPVGGIGLLVTGSSEGAVIAWNFETGEWIGTLSAGGFKPKKKQPQHARDNPIGGPLLRFSKTTAPENVKDSQVKGILHSLEQRTQNNEPGDHRGPITQVVVTRYCEVENGHGQCRGCVSCFGNGFMVASCSSDESVHAWRLERSGGPNVSCTLCAKDYHKKQYKRTRKVSTCNTDQESVGGMSPSPSPSSSLTTTHTATMGRPRKPSTSQSLPVRRVHRHIRPSRSSAQGMPDDRGDSLLDIEQLAGDAETNLDTRFLGKIDQVAGRGLVFCNNNILAGVRQKSAVKQDGDGSEKDDSDTSGQWEAWFAPLQYYDPPIFHDLGDLNALVHTQAPKIPIESFTLDPDPDQTTVTATTSTATLSLGSIIGSVFGINPPRPATKHARPWRQRRKAQVDSTGTRRRQEIKRNIDSEDSNTNDDDDDSFDDGEASEILPFSTVRHIIPLSNLGFACDFGNFIKVVTIHKEAGLIRYSNQALDETLASVVPLTATGDCICLGDSEDCCGGKDKVNGKCCGGKNKRRNRQANKEVDIPVSPPKIDITTCQVRSIADCSLKAHCSKAADCRASASKKSSYKL